MLINNFNKIKNFLIFPNSDTFYFCQIMQRKKDNIENITIKKEKNNNSRTIKTYYINSLEYFEKKEKEIIGLCDLFNARAYISVSPKSYEKLSFYTMKELAENLYLKNFNKTPYTFNSCCGKYSEEKIWVIDYDDKNKNVLDSIKTSINECLSKNVVYNKNILTIQKDNVLDVLETVNGYHLLTIPFDIRGINDFIESNIISIHKENPTLLYFNNIIGKNNEDI